MPAKSAKQERFMQAVAHNPKFAKKVGVPTSVGKEFTKSEGGMAESKKMVGKEVAFMKKKGALSQNYPAAENLLIKGFT